MYSNGIVLMMLILACSSMQHIVPKRLYPKGSSHMQVFLITRSFHGPCIFVFKSPTWTEVIVKYPRLDKVE